LRGGYPTGSRTDCDDFRGCSSVLEVARLFDRRSIGHTPEKICAAKKRAAVAQGWRSKVVVEILCFGCYNDNQTFLRCGLLLGLIDVTRYATSRRGPNRPYSQREST